MARKKQIDEAYNLEDLPLAKEEISSEKEDKKYIVNIEAVEITDDNIGFVLANLRFYKWDGRNYLSKKPFKIYENSWELGTKINKKIAEFATLKECDAAFEEIIKAYTHDFKTKYKLSRRTTPKSKGKGSSIPSDTSVSDGSPPLSNSNREPNEGIPNLDSNP